mmetsp:Transcript_21996/g.35374  ORF Transcript_21996/g.35374 Transcript_21996/m.35374 type:complete len:105 (+) Transcript_21996:15-329(+)
MLQLKSTDKMGNICFVLALEGCIQTELVNSKEELDEENRSMELGECVRPLVHSAFVLGLVTMYYWKTLGLEEARELFSSRDTFDSPLERSTDRHTLPTEHEFVV